MNNDLWKKDRPKVSQTLVTAALTIVPSFFPKQAIPHPHPSTPAVPQATNHQGAVYYDRTAGLSRLKAWGQTQMTDGYR